ncbi:MAG: aminotransferase class I/II-fold pyridoxal phosphate-dependent enzyme, partial [Pseudomonadota bacterium]
VTEIVSQWNDTTKMVFVTTPNNPTGHSFDMTHIERLIAATAGKGIVVIDAAYAEFADPEAIMALRRNDHVVVLRTLSKAYGLAGARCGSLIADPCIINLAEKVMPPYAVPTPTVEKATAAIASEAFSIMPNRIRALCEERERVRGALSAMANVEYIWPSDANFLLVTFTDADNVMQRAHDAGFLLRDFSQQPATLNSVRITIGERSANDALLRAIASGDHS